MRVIRHLARVERRLPGVVLTLGNFDGVHRGHQVILARAVAAARTRGECAVALTFHPHPVAVLVPARAPAMVQSLHDRLRTLEAAGVDVVVVQRFTRTFAALTPEEFVLGYLARSLEIVHVVIGYNVNFGRDRAGNADTLRTLGARSHFEVETIGPVQADGAAVSSSAVRRAIADGQVERVAALLGRRHRLRGRVVTGEMRGRTLGFPTANLHVKPRVELPADGVYAVQVHAGEPPRPAVLNIGIRPTFGERRRTIEAHLLDWQGDLYGRWLEVELVARLRGERQFAGPVELREAIAQDVAHARVVLGVGP